MGMGKLYAQLAVNEGAGTIVLWDINAAELEKTVAELKAKGGNVKSYIVDVSKLEAIVEAAAKIKAEVGKIDILINNAGVVRGKYFWEHDHLKDTWFTMSINALAPMYIAREFLTEMIADRGTENRIINISSAAGTVSNPKMSVYCASKWSTVGWSDSLRLELEQAGYHHVKVSTICPSYFSTGMFEGAKSPLMTPLMTPEYVVNRVWDAMKTGRSMLLIPWTVVVCKICKGLFPLWLWDFIADKIFGIYKTMEDFKGRDAENGKERR